MLASTPVQSQPANIAGGCSVGRRRLIIDLLAEHALTDPRAIDHLIDTVFNDLEHATVEVRVHDQCTETTL